MPPKVFISHTKDDKDRFVTEFARRLRAKGVDAWLDKWEIKPGDNLIDKIFTEGIGNAQALLVVLSSKSIKKPWVREELDAGFVRRIQNQTRLIPIVLDDCPIPVQLQSTLYVRIADPADYETQLDQIVAAIYGQNDKPPLGQAPEYAQTPVPEVPGLARIDNIILKLSCEDAIENDNFTSNPEAIWKRAEPLSITQEEMNDSLLILHRKHYIEGHRGDNRILAFKITLYGFHEYGKTHIPDIDGLFTMVAARIVNDDMTILSTIRDSLNQPRLIIEYILDVLASNGLLTVAKPIGRETIIVEVSPELKRMLQ